MGFLAAEFTVSETLRQNSYYRDDFEECSRHITLFVIRGSSKYEYVYVGDVRGTYQSFLHSLSRFLSKKKKVTSRTGAKQLGFSLRMIQSLQNKFTFVQKKK